MNSSDVQEINWASLGPLQLCPPFLYGVRVVPSPGFFASGFGGQNIMVRGNDRYGQRQPQVGTTRRPNASTLKVWAAYPVEAFLAGWCPHGGWAPHRSQEVCWGPDNQAYYKAADVGHWDVYWLVQPGDWGLTRSMAMLEADAHALMKDWELAVKHKAASFIMSDLREKPALLAVFPEVHAELRADGAAVVCGGSCGVEGAAL